MNKSKTVFSIAAFFTFCLLSFANASAQTDVKTQAEPVYEVLLQTLVASNNTARKTDVPQTFSGVIKKLKNNYTFNNYRVTSTYLERLASTSGSVEIRSVANALNQNQENPSPTFSEWSLGGLQNLQNSRGQTSIRVQNFRFSQRVPVKNVVNGTINYESIGLTLNKFGLPINEPTVIGSLGTANEELMFLVLTVNLMEN